MAERKKPRILRRTQGFSGADRADRLLAIMEDAVKRGAGPEELLETAQLLRRESKDLPFNTRKTVENKAADVRIQVRGKQRAEAIAVNQGKFEKALQAKQGRGAKAAESLKLRLGRQTQPGVLGAQPLQVADPRIAQPLTALGEAKTTSQARVAGRGLKSGVSALQSGKGRGLGLKKAGLGGLGAMGLGLLLPSLFGKKEQTIDPAIQMALAQQLGGGGQGTTSTLRDVARLLSILKSIQGMAGMQGPQAQGRPRLI